MKFGFIAHTSSEIDLKSFQFYDLSRELGILPDFRTEKLEKASCIDLIHIPEFKSKAGSITEGRVMYLPMTAEEMVENHEKAFEAVYKAAKDLEDWGAGIIGLGGFTGIIGNRGLDLKERIKVPITTGNSFTVYNSVYAAELLTGKLGLDLRDLKVAIVGFPGSIGLAIAKIMAAKDVPMVLVGRRDAKFFENIIAKIKQGHESAKIEFTSNVNEALKSCNVIFSATSSGEIIDPVEIPPWSIFLDIAVPGDVKYILPDNTNLLYIYGGTFDLRPEVEYGGVIGKLLRNNFPGCIGETVLLAWENIAEYFSIGRELDVEKVALIGKLGHKHGFEVITPYDGFTSLPVSDELLANIKRRMSKEKVHASSGAPSNYFGEYLDFNCAQGELLIQRHPRISDVLKTAQANPAAFNLTANAVDEFERLSEKLSQMAPDNLKKAFFTNSLAELMIEVTNLSTSYTGKQNIALTSDPTGLAKLNPDRFQWITFGDLSSLESALATGSFAAFITEPIMANGELIIPAEDYLEKAWRICQENQCLFILNESKTGLGRAGSIFISKEKAIQPDVLILGNILGAGVFPLSCFLTGHSLVQDVKRNMIAGKNFYTNTYLNPLAGKVAAELIDIIAAENLAPKALENGRYLLDKLRDLQAGNPIITCVDGIGLIINVKLMVMTVEDCAEIFGDMLSMIGQDIANLKIFSFPNISELLGKFFEEFSGEVFKAFQYSMDERNSQILWNEYHIFCPSQGNSFMIFPPLNSAKEDLDQFLAAFNQLCEKVYSFASWRKRNLG